MVVYRFYIRNVAELTRFFCQKVIRLFTDFAEGSLRLRRCLVTGLFANAARLHHTGTYRTIKHNYELRVHKGSAICYNTEKFPAWLAFFMLILFFILFT